MQVEGQHGGSSLPPMATGARVSNAYPTFRMPGDSPSKEGLIPDGPRKLPGLRGKGFRHAMGVRPISLLAG